MYLLYSRCIYTLQKKIQNEIDSRVVIEVAYREKLPYTVAIVCESLRYTSGAGPLCFPHAAKKDVVFEGYTIEKGSVILGNHWHIHHDPKLWNDP